jgi:hypothetical protein
MSVNFDWITPVISGYTISRIITKASNGKIELVYDGEIIKKLSIITNDEGESFYILPSVDSWFLAEFHSPKLRDTESFAAAFRNISRLDAELSDDRIFPINKLQTLSLIRDLVNDNGFTILSISVI